MPCTRDDAVVPEPPHAEPVRLVGADTERAAGIAAHLRARVVSVRRFSRNAGPRGEEDRGHGDDEGEYEVLKGDTHTEGIRRRWAPEPRPCFNPALLADIRAFQEYLAGTSGTIDCNGEEHPVEYVVLASDSPGVFNLGGDLDLFKQLIDARDRQGLLRYGRACIDVLYRWYKNANVPLTTISLVQGEALGGGFECALGSSVLIAEEDARMGFPEVLFNLFPGMGAYSFLSRKVGRRTTDELITSGAIYTARQLYDMGVVDVITVHPPYVAKDEVDHLPDEIKKFEPVHTLTDHSDDGLGFVERMADEAWDWLCRGGWVLVEIAPDRARSVASILRAEGFADVRSTKGGMGVTRVVVGRAAT